VRAVHVASALLATAACGKIVGLQPKAPPVIAASDRAPAFALPSHQASTVDLATTFAANDVVLVFYRGHW
jgi:hypothetical protein